MVENFEALARLFEGVSSVIWPVLVGAALLGFRHELSALLGRIRKGRLLGQEFELSDNLDRLDLNAKLVSQRLEPNTHAPTRFVESDRAASKNTGKILHEAIRSPKLGLLLLADEIDREVRNRLASSGREPKDLDTDLPERIDRLLADRDISEELASAIESFRKVSNQVTHRGKATDQQILRTVVAGLQILESIKLLPHQTNRVKYTNIPVFADPECERRYPDIFGVGLELIISNKIQFMVYPTTRVFEEGKHVSWEWGTNAFPTAWYRDPETSSKMKAWDHSLEFIGRTLDESELGA